MPRQPLTGKALQSKRFAGRCLFLAALFELHPDAFRQFCHEAQAYYSALQQATHPPKRGKRAARRDPDWNDAFSDLAARLQHLRAVRNLESLAASSPRAEPARSMQSEGESRVRILDPLAGWGLFAIVLLSLRRIESQQRPAKSLEGTGQGSSQQCDPWSVFRPTHNRFYDDKTLRRDACWLARCIHGTVKPVTLAREASVAVITARKALSRFSRLIRFPPLIPEVAPGRHRSVICFLGRVDTREPCLKHPIASSASANCGSACRCLALRSGAGPGVATSPRRGNSDRIVSRGSRATSPAGW